MLRTRLPQSTLLPPTRRWVRPAGCRCAWRACREGGDAAEGWGEEAVKERGGGPGKGRGEAAVNGRGREAVELQRVKTAVPVRPI